LSASGHATRVVGRSGERVDISAGHLELIASSEPVYRIRDWGPTAVGRLVMRSEKRRTLWKVIADVVESGTVTTWAPVGSYVVAYEGAICDSRNAPDVRVRLVSARWARLFCLSVKVAWLGGDTSVTTSVTTSIASGKRGRKPGTVKLSKWEREAVRKYCDGESLADIDATISNQRGAVRGVGVSRKEWSEGDAILVIKAAKRRKSITKTLTGWEIVTD